MKKVKAYAKVNLGLSVLGIASNNYHYLEMVMVKINLYDTLYFKELKENQIIIEGMTLKQEDNLVYKAIKLIKDKYKINKGIYVKIKKRIPVQAGLGGGSADAAATLMYLNQTWDLNLNDNEMIKLAFNLGSDVCFFTSANAALVEGFGEKITPINLKHFKFALVVPPFSCSTKEVYEQVNHYSETKKTYSLIKALESGDINEVIDNTFNDLEVYADSVTNGKISKIKDELLLLGFDKALMTGSGSGIMAFLRSPKSLNKLIKTISTEKYKVYAINTNVYKKK